MAAKAERNLHEAKEVQRNKGSLLERSKQEPAGGNVTIQTPAETQTGTPSSALPPETLLEMYWAMLISRRVDERSWVLHRQGKIAFHISAMGHEATQIGMAFAINRGVDYVHPYYRDLALVLALGVTPRDFMISLFGKAGE